MTFDYLKNSYSTLHRAFIPYSKETFLVLNRLINDLVSEGDGQIPIENLPLINEILSLEKITTKVFDSSEEACALLGNFLK